MSKWHPIQNLQEPQPGVWIQSDALGREYGRIELRRVNDGELRYKVTVSGEILGWAGSLKYAAERLHAHFIMNHGPRGGPNQWPPDRRQ
ncbi:hypothetical protein ACI7YT_12785 [Microbacterium sp. M]|uniref:hypothetical protein n=1 Tax=Microbacterium sp. M TaxID=3377125 RepID=UPI00386B128A